jgi:hypothetical protein
MNRKNAQRLLSVIPVVTLLVAGLTLGSIDPQAKPLPTSTMLDLGDVLTISSAADVQGLPAVAWNPRCDVFLVVWQDRRNGVDDDIWGRYVSGTGEALATGEFNLTRGRAGHQRAPAVAYQPAFGRFIVVWMDDTAGNWDISGQYFDCQKQPTSDLIAICTKAGSQQYPDVACRYGLSWVVWQDRRNGNWDIYGQRVDPDGDLLGDNMFVSNQANDQTYAAIAANPEDTGCTLMSFLVTWRDFRNLAASSLDIYDQQLSDGGRCAPNRAVYTEIRAQTFPDLDYGTEDDHYLVVWQDDRAGATTWDIYARRVWPNGAPDGDAFALSAASQNQWLPAVAYNDDENEFFVVWQDYRNAAYWRIAGQRVSGGGALVGGNFPLADAGSDTIDPAVAYGGAAEQYLVVWSEGGNIYGRAYAP